MSQRETGRLKKADVFIVRFLPLVLFIMLGDIILDSWRGISQYPFNLLHSNSAIYSSALFFISLADRKYHCIWNRAMYVVLIITPLINYLDAKFSIFNDVTTLIAVISVTWFLAAIVTVFLAVRHFVIAMRKKYRRGLI